METRHPVRFGAVTGQAELTLLDAALQALSTDLGDRHPPQTETLQRALTGPHPAAHAMLALPAAVAPGPQPLGAALFSPVYSTVRAAPGVYVSDLWVAPEARGGGLGARLLAQVGGRAATLWGAEWLKLAVYDHSTAAQAFYRRLGFRAARGMQEMHLDPARLRDLVDRAGV